VYIHDTVQSVVSVYTDGDNWYVVCIQVVCTGVGCGQTLPLLIRVPMPPLTG